MISTLGRNYPHILANILSLLDDYAKATLYEASGTLGIVADNAVEYKMRHTLRNLTCLDRYLYHYLETGLEKASKRMLCDAYRHYMKTFKAPVICKNPYSCRLLKILILGDDSVEFRDRKTILDAMFTPGKSKLNRVNRSNETDIYYGFSHAMDSEIQAECNNELFIHPSENLHASMKVSLTDYEYVLFLSMCQPKSNDPNNYLWDLCDYLSKTDNPRQTKLLHLTLSDTPSNSEDILTCLKWSFKTLQRVAVDRHNKICQPCLTQGPTENCSKLSEEFTKLSRGLKVFHIAISSAKYLQDMTLVMTHIFGDFFTKIK